MNSTFAEQLEKYKIQEQKIFHVARTDLLCDPGCILCGGTGFYRLELPVTDPQFGRIYPCENRLRAHEAEFPGFSALRNLNQMSSHASKILNVIKNGHGLVYIFGSYGVGKTTLLKASIEECRRRGFEGRCIDAIALVDDLRLAFDMENQNTAIVKKMATWREIPALAIDELERPSPTPFVAEKLFSLYNQRYEDSIAARTITFVASNLSPAAQPGYWASRVADGRGLIIEIKGTDLRPGITPSISDHERLRAKLKAYNHARKSN